MPKAEVGAVMYSGHDKSAPISPSGSFPRVAGKATAFSAMIRCGSGRSGAPDGPCHANASSRPSRLTGVVKPGPWTSSISATPSP